MARKVAATETWPCEVEKCPLGRLGLAMDQRERQIAAEDDAALARKPIGQASRERADAGDRHDAERDAGDEHRESRAGRRAIRGARSATDGNRRSASARPRSCGHGPRRVFDAAGAQPHDAVAALRQRIVVRDQHQRGAALDVAGEQQVDHLPAGRLVEIAGRLVGDENRRIGRQRAGERDALLLAAGQLRRIVSKPFGEADRGQFVARSREARPRRRPAPAAPRRSPAPSWSGSDERTGTRCRHCGRESAPAHPRRAPRSSPATMIEPVSARSSPAITISSVDFPEPDGPTRPIASPRPICRSMILEDMNPGRAAAERQIDAGERDGRIRPQSEMSFMDPDAGARVKPRPAHMGSAAASSSGLRRCCCCACARGSDGHGAGAAERTIKIVALGDSLTAGLSAAGERRVPGAARDRRCKAKGIAVEVANAGVSGDTASGGLARLDWSVPDGTDAVILELGANDMLRGIDPKMTRAGARRRSSAGSRRAISRCCLRGMRAPPNLGATTPRVRRDLSGSRGGERRRALSVLPRRRRRPTPSSTSDDGLHPTAAGVAVIVSGSCRRSRS